MNSTSTNSFHLKPIQPNDPRDLAAVLEVYRQCEDFLSLGPQPKASLEMVLADLELSRQEGGTFYGIFDPQTGVMTGIVDFVTSGFAGDPSLAYLSLLMIAAPYRSRGLGEAVVRAVEDAVRHSGQVCAIQAGVQVNNPGAIRFWQRMGYRIVSPAEPQLDGTVAYRLLKDLF